MDGQLSTRATARPRYSSEISERGVTLRLVTQAPLPDRLQADVGAARSGPMHTASSVQPWCLVLLVGGRANASGSAVVTASPEWGRAPIGLVLVVLGDPMLVAAVRGDRLQSGDELAGWGEFEVAENDRRTVG